MGKYYWINWFVVIMGCYYCKGLIVVDFVIGLFINEIILVYVKEFLVELFVFFNLSFFRVWLCFLYVVWFYWKSNFFKIIRKKKIYVYMILE